MLEQHARRKFFYTKDRIGQPLSAQNPRRGKTGNLKFIEVFYNWLPAPYGV